MQCCFCREAAPSLRHCHLLPRSLRLIWTSTWSEGCALYCKEIKSHLNFFKMRTVFADGKKPMRTRWHLGVTPNFVQDTHREDRPREVNVVTCQMLQISHKIVTVLSWAPGLREDISWIWSLLLVNFPLYFDFCLQGTSAGARRMWYLLFLSSSHLCHHCSHSGPAHREVLIPVAFCCSWMLFPGLRQQKTSVGDRVWAQVCAACRLSRQLGCLGLCQPGVTAAVLQGGAEGVVSGKMNF